MKISALAAIAGFATIAAIGLTATAQAQSIYGQDYSYHQGYTNNNGSYVQPHYQTNPNGSAYDNWSTQGNTNPITGQRGTHRAW
jgi:hypothetical protein